MPDISLRIQVGDAVEVVHAIESQLADPSEFMQDVLLIMIRSTQLTFQEGGRPTKWTPLAMSTIEGRLRRDASGRATLRGVSGSSGTTENAFAPDNKAAGGKFGKAAVKAQDKFFAAVGEMKILRDTGRLLMSVGGGQAGAFEDEQGFGESDQFTATLGTNHPGAEALQFIIAGGRPFLVFQDIDEEDIMDASVQFVMMAGPYAQ